MVGAFPVKVPQIDMHTVGAGGGSIAWLDVDGSLQVGPRSAGATPGPGGLRPGRHRARPSPTPTWCSGRIGTRRRLGGSIGIDPALARRRWRSWRARMSRPLGVEAARRGHRHDRGRPHDLRHPGDLDPAWPRSARLHPDRLRGRRAHARRSRWRTRSASRGSSCRATPATSRRSACSPPTSSTTTSAPAWARSRERCAALRQAFRGDGGRGAGGSSSVEGFALEQQRLRRSLDLRYRGQAFELNIRWPTASSGSTRSRPISIASITASTATPTRGGDRAGQRAAHRLRPRAQARRGAARGARASPSTPRSSSAGRSGSAARPHDCPVWERERLPERSAG